jgi:hypothetical protein
MNLLLNTAYAIVMGTLVGACLLFCACIALGVGGRLGG